MTRATILLLAILAVALVLGLWTAETAAGLLAHPWGAR